MKAAHIGAPGAADTPNGQRSALSESARR